MRTLITSLLITFFFSSFAQKEISTKLSENHIYVKGSKIHIIPPPEFTQADNFIGLQNILNGSSIVVLDMPAPFEKAVKNGFTQEQLADQGIELHTTERLVINGLPGILMTGRQFAFGTLYDKTILIFGSENETIIITGAVPSVNIQKKELMIETLLSAYYDKSIKIDPFEELDFSISYKGSGLVFAKALSGMIVLNKDGIVPSIAEDKSALFLGKAHSELPISDKKDYCVRRIKNIPNNPVEEIESIFEVKYGGLEGYEIIANSKNKTTNQHEKIYLVLLFSDAPYYFLIGTTNQNYDENINIFRKITDTLKVKDK